MRGKRLFRRLRAMLGRAKAAKKAAGGQQKPDIASTGTDPVIVHHTQGQQDALVSGLESAAHDAPSTKASVEELRASADPQRPSSFFSALPLEIRLKIYHEVWRAYLQPQPPNSSTPRSRSDLRLHLYTPSPASTRLMHTRCLLQHPDEPVQEDSCVTRPWPFDNYGVNPPSSPPRWFFEAWVLRLNWGKHWKCQHAVQKRWDPLVPGGDRQSGGERAPFLPLFLACKKMSVSSPLLDCVSVN